MTPAACILLGSVWLAAKGYAPQCVPLGKLADMLGDAPTAGHCWKHSHLTYRYNLPICVPDHNALHHKSRSKRHAR